MKNEEQNDVTFLKVLVKLCHKHQTEFTIREMAAAYGGGGKGTKCLRECVCLWGGGGGGAFDERCGGGGFQVDRV